MTLGRAIINYFLQDRIKQVHYGPVLGCPPGTCWGLRMECSRDGIHKPFNDSVDDEIYGATSICTSHLNVYNDVDFGDILTFTLGKYTSDHKIQSLIANLKNKLPVRLVRSYCLSNEYAPKTGYRYDGLYSVAYHWIGVSADNSKCNKFILVRLTNQEPSVWVEKSEKSGINSKRTYCHRLTRSQNVQMSHSPTLVHNELPKEPTSFNTCAIVSRQSFTKLINDSPDSSFNLSPKLCNTNLSIRTNLYDSSHNSKKLAQPSCYKLVKTNLQSLEDQSNRKQSEHTSEDNQSIILETLSCPHPCDSTSNGIDNIMTKCINNAQTQKPEVAKNCNHTACKEPLVQVNSQVNPISADSTTMWEKERSLDALAPDKLVNAIIRRKYHPMAKLLIGNIIGLENHESAILTAYNTLMSKVGQDDYKENGIKKYYLKNKQRKSSVLKKQVREIANLAIDAKFETITRATRRNGRLRSLKKLSKSELVPKRKIMNVKRLQIHKAEKRKIDNKRKPNTKNVAVQCEPLVVHQSIQTCTNEDSDEIMSVDDIKDEVIEIKSEPEDVESDIESSSSEINTEPRPGSKYFHIF